MSLGFSEIFFILLIVLLLFGPGKIPEIARGLGEAMRYLRNTTDDIKREVMTPLDEPSQTYKQVKQQVNEAREDLLCSTKHHTVDQEKTEQIDGMEGSIKREY